MREQFFVSKEVLDKIKELPESISFGGYNFPIRESSLFPFEIMYDACDVETKSEIKVSSGEWIHGVAIPAFDWGIDWQSYDFKGRLESRMDNWFNFKGMEVYP